MENEQKKLSEKELEQVVRAAMYAAVEPIIQQYIHNLKWLTIINNKNDKPFPPGGIVGDPKQVEPEFILSNERIQEAINKGITQKQEESDDKPDSIKAALDLLDERFRPNIDLKALLKQNKHEFYASGGRVDGTISTMKSDKYGIEIIFELINRIWRWEISISGKAVQSGLALTQDIARKRALDYINQSL